MSAARAEISVSCDYTANKKTAFCVTNDDGDKTLIRCDKNKNGTWRCAVVPAEVRGGVTVGPGLNRAVLNAAARAKRPLQTK